MLVPNLHWIIIEDGEGPSPLVANLLKNSGITYTHLTAATPKEWKLKEKVCLLPPWSRVLLEKLILTQLFKKFPTFYGTQRFVTMFTRAYNWSLSQANGIQSMQFQLQTKLKIIDKR